LSFILSPGDISEAPGDFCAYAATAVLTKSTATSALIFFIGSSITSLLLRHYFVGFCGAGPDLFPGNPGTLLVSPINAAGLTARILLRLCGWTRLVPRQPLNTGSTVWRPGGLRESRWGANHNSGCDQQDHSAHDISSSNDESAGPDQALLFLSLAADINVESRSAEFNAWAAMVVVVSVAVIHVEAVTSLDTTRSAEAFVADLATDAFCVGGNCQQCRSCQDRGSGSHERNRAHVFTSIGDRQQPCNITRVPGNNDHLNFDTENIFLSSVGNILQRQLCFYTSATNDSLNSYKKSNLRCGSSFSLESNKNEGESSCMDREQIKGSAEKAKGIFEDTSGKVTEDKKLIDEVESRTASRHLVFWSYVLAFFFTAGILALRHLG
jgi:hypothetical protein